jgi:hypothetical protein
VDPDDEIPRTRILLQGGNYFVEVSVGVNVRGDEFLDLDRGIVLGIASDPSGNEIVVLFFAGGNVNGGAQYGLPNPVT